MIMTSAKIAQKLNQQGIQYTTHNCSGCGEDVIRFTLPKKSKNDHDITIYSINNKKTKCIDGLCNITLQKCLELMKK